MPGVIPGALPQAAVAVYLFGSTPSSLRYTSFLVFCTAHTRSLFNGRYGHADDASGVSVGKPLFWNLLPGFPNSVGAFQGPNPPPLLRECRGTTARSNVEAHRMRGLLGSRVRSVAPAFSLAKSTRFQVVPPSKLLYTPRSWVGL